MLYVDIANAAATLSEALSKRLIRELLHSKWLCYGSVTTKDLDIWIDAFLKTHARIPGIVRDCDGEEIPIWSATPLEVCRFFEASERLRTEGVLYTNGAVVTIYKDNLEPQTLLFVSPEDALYWHYPDKNYVIFSKTKKD